VTPSDPFGRRRRRATFGRDAVLQRFRVGYRPLLRVELARRPKGLLAGAAERVGSVRSDVHRAVLSNTNELHWNERPDAGSIHQLFETHFASHRVGLVKPHAAI
jgi:FMN phosphatase YigB (HAD superfamily)